MPPPPSGLPPPLLAFAVKETTSVPSVAAGLAWTWMMPGTRSPAWGTDWRPGDAKPPMMASIAFTEPFFGSRMRSHDGRTPRAVIDVVSAVAPAGRSVPSVARNSFATSS